VREIQVGQGVHVNNKQKRTEYGALRNSGFDSYWRGVPVKDNSLRTIAEIAPESLEEGTKHAHTI
jgi:hypothetical protein